MIEGTTALPTPRRSSNRAAIVLLLLGMIAPTARAGIYNLEEPPPNFPPPYKQIGSPAPATSVLDWCGKLLNVHDSAQPKDRLLRELRQAYAAQVEELRRRKKDRGLTTSEAVSFTACLLRMGRQGEAMAALEEALGRCSSNDPGRFLLLLHKATAYDQVAELQSRAVAMQEEALKSWPGAWIGWGREELAWYYRAEKYQLELMKLRERQSRAGAAGKDGVDPLFPRVRWVGRSGKYEAGGIAPARAAELPVDAEAVVVQLLLWQPADVRLKWLYGELLNARGDVADALVILSSLSFYEGLSGVPELMAHRKVLDGAGKAHALLQERKTRRELLLRGGIHASDGGLGVAEAVREVASMVPVPEVDIGTLRGAPPPTTKPGGGNDTTPPPSRSAGDNLPDLQVLGTGALIGAFLSLIAVLQWQQWQRRNRVPPR